MAHEARAHAAQEPALGHAASLPQGRMVAYENAAPVGQLRRATSLVRRAIAYPTEQGKAPVAVLSSLSLYSAVALHRRVPRLGASQHKKNSILRTCAPLAQPCYRSHNPRVGQHLVTTSKGQPALRGQPAGKQEGTQRRTSQASQGSQRACDIKQPASTPTCPQHALHATSTSLPRGFLRSKRLKKQPRAFASMRRFIRSAKKALSPLTGTADYLAGASTCASQLEDFAVKPALRPIFVSQRNHHTAVIRTT